MKPSDAHPVPPDATAPAEDDARAIARYLYLLRTAPPEAIERVHADAFRRLTDAQRRELLERIGQVLPPYERSLATPVNGTPVGLARLITRAEMRQPGTLARLFGPALGVGAVLGASLLGSIAGTVMGSALAAPLLAGAPTAALAPVPDVAAPDDTGAAPVEDASVDPVAEADFESDLASDFGLGDLFDV